MTNLQFRCQVYYYGSEDKCNNVEVGRNSTELSQVSNLSQVELD